MGSRATAERLARALDEMQKDYISYLDSFGHPHSTILRKTREARAALDAFKAEGGKL